MEICVQRSLHEGRKLSEISSSLDEWHVVAIMELCFNLFDDQIAFYRAE